MPIVTSLMRWKITEALSPGICRSIVISFWSVNLTLDLGHWLLCSPANISNCYWYSVWVWSPPLLQFTLCNLNIISSKMSGLTIQSCHSISIKRVSYQESHPWFVVQDVRCWNLDKTSCNFVLYRVSPVSGQLPEFAAPLCFLSWFMVFFYF